MTNLIQTRRVVLNSTRIISTGGGGGGGGTGVSGGGEATAFLARTTGLDATHTNAYIALIDGLVADSVWSRLDVLHIYATQDSTTALLNLVSSSYNGTNNGGNSPFTADRGFLGSNGSSTVFIDTGFNPSTASLPKYTQDSAHLSTWPLSNTSNNNGGIGAGPASGNVATNYIAESQNNFFILRVNATGGNGNQAVAENTALGHYIGNRSNSTTQQGYKNGANILTSTTDPSHSLANLNIYTLAINSNGTAAGCARQLAMASIGSSLSSTDATNFYNRLRTYMTAVGVP